MSKIDTSEYDEREAQIDKDIEDYLAYVQEEIIKKELHNPTLE